MSEKSNNQGRAFEFACLTVLQTEIEKFRPVRTDKGGSYGAAQRAWEETPDEEQEKLMQGATAAAQTVFSLEPLITEDGNDLLTLSLQADEAGERGDVRDILIIRRAILWEIGLSVKHNHFAVKHSRLSDNVDFGEKWFGVPCSEEYWRKIQPIFDRLRTEKEKGTLWREMDDKAQNIYLPLLNAFMEEVQRADATHKGIPRKMTEYLLGEYDFYKVIGIDAKRVTEIQAYNLRGTLNRAGKHSKPARLVPITALPTRIVSLDFKPNSTNTVELYMDNGWQFSFRIHNAATKVEPSLKFDIQLIGLPVTILSLQCSWQ